MSEKLTERRAALRAELDELLALDAPTAEQEERADAILADLEKIDERRAALDAAAEREAKAAEARKGAPAEHTPRVSVREPNPVYRRGDAATSFFRDLALASKPTLPGFDEARSRLIAAQETRAGDMTTVSGAGGEFAPPLWLVEDFVALARPGRVTADLCNGNTLPSGVSTINLPKVASGVSVGVQATQNSAVSDTAMTTTSVSSGITTLSGKQIISQQLLDQSGIPFDRVVLQDLAKAYAAQLDTQVLYGSNASGQLNGLVNTTNAVAFTTTTPAPASTTAANSLYYAVSKAEAAVWAAIYEPADAIIMHPRRWAWILGSVDANSRPFVIPNGASFNPLGVGEGTPQGYAGTFGDLPVYVDPNISVTANSATNQDEIYVVRRSELWLYETPVHSASFDATYADQLSVLFRVHGYAAFIPNRYTGAVQSIRGTGLVTPA